jgi:electron transfer flavoprotein alpha subunit
MADERGVLVLGEYTDGALTGLTAELLGAARRVAGQLGGPVSLVLLGESPDSLAQGGIALGADRVYLTGSPALNSYLPSVWLRALRQTVEQAGPAVILLGQSNIGRDLAPRLAFQLGTGVAMDTVELAVEGGRVLMTRPCFGGNAREVVSIQTMPQIATVRAKSQEPLEPDPARQGEVVSVPPVAGGETRREEVVSRANAQTEGVRLEDARIVVSGGRGLGGPEGFRLVEQLATAMGGAVGASRAACDLGWYPPSHQVGLTGKSVSPDLYVAVAISGASQHWAGMANSKNVVAINKDPEANMVKGARFALIADYKQAIPPLIDAIQRLKA